MAFHPRGSRFHNIDFFEKNAKKTRQITWLKGVRTIYAFDLFDLKWTEILYMYISGIDCVALPHLWQNFGVFCKILVIFDDCF